ncbi:hypothetical protein GWK47_054153 [Chionoecetes opilio]|uniref:Uncharacterized protein n=1 Tax=Chionoecetes opilio TaxID=41210 RepID=A0A8J4Y0F3_CHIOP|nr:hypothetical protein GWK47_054153 [Chionoecetes opilio]
MTSTVRTPKIHQRCRTSQQKGRATGESSFQRIFLEHGHNIPAVGESYSVFLQQGKFSDQVPGRRMEKKPQATEKLEGPRSVVSTCEQLCFKITKEQWEEAPELKLSAKKKQTQAPPSPGTHAAENLGNKSVSSHAEDTDVMVPWCTGHVPQESHPTCSDKCLGTIEQDKNSWISLTS